MSIFDPLNNYCERSGPGLWDEPLNAVSNLAFFIAAWALYKAYCSQSKKDGQAVILISLITLVGIGSTLFHTFANKLTLIFDVLPIALFTFYYLWVALRRLLGLTKFKSATALVLFALVASQMHHIPDGYRFNGSVDYFPCLGALLIITAVLYRRKHPSAPLLLKASLCFMLSLTFRSVDFMVCPAFPIGTHFLWHSLNGLMLYLLTKAIIRVI